MLSNATPLAQIQYLKEMLVKIRRICLQQVGWTGFSEKQPTRDEGSREKSHETSENKLRKELGVSFYGIPHRQIKVSSDLVLDRDFCVM